MTVYFQVQPVYIPEILNWGNAVSYFVFIVFYYPVLNLVIHLI
jgi:hypothetical protein